MVFKKIDYTILVTCEKSVLDWPTSIGSANCDAIKQLYNLLTNLVVYGFWSLHFAVPQVIMNSHCVLFFLVSLLLLYNFLYREKTVPSTKASLARQNRDGIVQRRCNDHGDHHGNEIFISPR